MKRSTAPLAGMLCVPVEEDTIARICNTQSAGRKYLRFGRAGCDADACSDFDGRAIRHVDGTPGWSITVPVVSYDATERGAL
jgi:hypothetical protein